MDRTYCLKFRSISSLLVFASFLVVSNASWAAPTVCAITINSSNEIEAARNQFSQFGYKFVELTQFGDSWFQESCRRKIQCDMLVISGHFAGIFFGESNKTLSISELEKASCQSECDGILKKPKEVFLFGCNTLASKKQDHRSPEEYRRVLLHDGFSPALAEQVVTFRYSPIGVNFTSRMSHIFRQTPRIYGFNSVSPLGKFTGPMFNNYLTKQGPRDYESYLNQLSPGLNKNMHSAFRSTSFVQTAGREWTDKKVNPLCVLESDDRGGDRVSKLEWVRDQMSTGEKDEIITYLNEYFKTQSWRKKWNSAELQIISDIGQIPGLREQFEKILSQKQVWMRRMQSEILELMYALRMISLQEQKSRSVQLLGLNKTPFTEADMRYLCGLGVKVNIDPQMIIEENWKNESFRYAMKCLASPWPQSAELWKMIERHEERAN